MKAIVVPWADRSGRPTYQYEIKVIDHLQDTHNQTETSWSLGCSINRISTIMERSVVRGLERRGEVSVAPMRIDEKAIKWGHKVAPILSDADTGVVLDLAEGRGYKEAMALVEATISKENRVRVATFTMAMWRPYIKLWESLLKESPLIYDCFHLIKMLHVGMDKVRKREAKRHPDILRYRRFALLKHPEDRTEKQDQVFETSMGANTEVGKAWLLRRSL